MSAVAKNVLDFCRWSAALSHLEPEAVAIDPLLVTYVRGRGPRDHAASNTFVGIARREGLRLEVVAERFRFDPTVLGQLRKLTDEFCPDIVATHNVKSHCLVGLLGSKRRYAWVAFHHGYTAEDLKQRAYNQLNRWSLRRADRVVTVCRAFARQLGEQGIDASKIVVQSNSIERVAPPTPDEVAEARKRCGIADGDRTRLIVAVGRLSREKGHADLVRAFALLRKARPEMPVKLAILGEGPERRAIELASRRDRVARDVMLLGHVDDVRPYYSAADVFVLPSLSEGSPYVLLEAMLAEVPIVAAAVGGIPDTVRDRVSALLVRAGDPSALARAMQAILEDTGLAKSLARRASGQVLTGHSPATYARAMMALYRDVVAREPGVPDALGTA